MFAVLNVAFLHAEVAGQRRERRRCLEAEVASRREEERERFKGFESLYVLPLLVKDEVMGTFTVAAQRAGAFPADRREMLGVIANQVAISLQNGRMAEALEEKATTDGLTGLTNHRTFQERFSAMLGRVERHQMHVSFLLTDIDHFKKINDTHGHPTGDQVLRRVAAILKASARKIDIVARYGSVGTRPHSRDRPCPGPGWPRSVAVRASECAGWVHACRPHPRPRLVWGIG